MFPWVKGQVFSGRDGYPHSPFLFKCPTSPYFPAWLAVSHGHVTVSSLMQCENWGVLCSDLSRHFALILSTFWTVGMEMPYQLGNSGSHDARASPVLELRSSEFLCEIRWGCLQGSPGLPLQGWAIFPNFISKHRHSVTSQGLNWRKGILQVKFTLYSGWVSGTVDQNWNLYQTVSQEDKKESFKTFL